MFILEFAREAEVYSGTPPLSPPRSYIRREEVGKRGRKLFWIRLCRVCQSYFSPGFYFKFRKISPPLGFNPVMHAPARYIRIRDIFLILMFFLLLSLNCNIFYNLCSAQRPPDDVWSRKKEKGWREIIWTNKIGRWGIHSLSSTYTLDAWGYTLCPRPIL